MSNNIGPVDIEFALKNLNFQQEAEKMKQSIRGITTTAQQEAEKTNAAFKHMAAGVGIYFSASFLKDFAKEVINIRGEFQQLSIAFETMLGSKEKADRLMQEAIAFSQKTPFTLTDVATNIKQLMAMGIAAEKVMGTMKALGDVAAGVSVPISRVAVNYGQVAVLGKLQEREIRDFAMAGIPLIDELAKNLGKSKDEIQKMVSASQIGFPEVEKAFETMSSVGGRFYDLMEKQNASVTGQISNLADKWQIMLNDIGEANEGLIYSGISATSQLIAHYEEVVDALKVLVASYGVYKAASIAVAVADSYAAAAKLAATKTVSLMSTETVKLTFAQYANARAQAVLNGVMKVNPYVLAATSIATLITALSVFGDTADEAAKAQAEINSTVNDQKANIQSLIAQINGENTANADRAKALKELNDLLPDQIGFLDQQALATEKGKKAIDDYIESIRKKAEMEQLTANLKKNLDEQDRISRGDLTNMEKFNAPSFKFQAGEQDYGQQQSRLIFDLKVQEDAIKSQMSALMASTEEQKKNNEAKARTLELINQDIEAAKKAQESSTNKKQYDEHQKTINRLETEKTAITGLKDAEKKREAEQKKAQEEANKRSKALLDYETEIGRQRIANQLEIEQGLLDLQEESAAKSIAQAELDFQKTLVQIANQKAEQLQKLNLVIGGIDEKTGKKTDKYVSTLSEADQKQIDEKVILAEQTKNNIINQINKKTAENIKELWTKVNESRLSEIAKERAAVKDYFDKMEEEARKAGDSKALNLIPSLRKKANDSIDRKEALSKLDFEEKLELQRNEIQAKGYARERELMKLNYETFVKYQKARAAILKASGDPEAMKQAELIEKAIQTETLKLEKELLSDKMQTLIKISETLDGIIEKHREQLGITKDQAELLKNTLGMTEIIGKVASGDYVGASIQVITTLADIFLKAPEKLSVHFESVNKQIGILINSLETAERSMANIGKDSSLTSLKIIKAEMLDLADEAKSLNTELEKSSTGRRRSGEMNFPYRDMVKDAALLNVEIEKLSNRLIKGDLTEEQRKSIEAVLNSYNDLVAAIDNTIQDITGTTVSDLSRGLADAFLSGEDAAEQWGQKVDDIIKNVIIRQLTAQMLTKPITDAVNTLVNDSGNGLTMEEAEKFKQTMDKLYTSSAPAFEAIQKALSTIGIDFGTESSTNKSGLQGSVKGATEETMGALVGQLMAVRVDIKEILRSIAYGQDDLEQNILYLKQIAENTAHNKKLNSIDARLEELNRTLSTKL